jgi:hypothetical protein
MCRLILFRFLLLMGASSALADGVTQGLFHKLVWNEIRPSSLANDAIIADQVRGPSLVDHDGESILMAGKNNIWRWSLMDGSVSRIAVPEEASDGMSIVKATSQFILVIGGRSGWVFSRKIKAWQRLSGAFEISCQPKQFAAVPHDDLGKVYVLTDCGHYLFFLESLQMVTLTKSVGFGFDRHPLPTISGLDGGALVPIGDRLMSLQFDGTRVREKLIYQAKSRIRGVVPSSRGYVAWTAQALIFFDRSLARVQVVPVIGRRKIQAFASDEEHHLVLFSDGGVEVMQLSSQMKWAGAGYFFESASLVSGRRLAILSSDAGPPRVFSMITLR